jgi:hypothetical protein
MKAFPRPHQKTLDVEAGSNKNQIFYLEIPGGNIGFIRHVANSYWSPDILYWSIDGTPVEEGIQRSVGTFAAPREITPWFRMPVREKIEWTVDNKGLIDHDYEVLCMGFYVLEEDLELLFKLGGGPWG